MVFLNGEFIAKDRAFISILDRGFLFGDGVYEVIPVYNGKIFRLKNHLERLQKSLNAVQIDNPYGAMKWEGILTKLITFSTHKNQSLYLQITRGEASKRQHSFTNMRPTIYIHSNLLALKSKQDLACGFAAISAKDIRWGRCDIKTTSLLANVLYAQQARENNAEEIILFRHNKITEGATSNVFMLKNNTLFTHPADHQILSGITRNLVLQSAKTCQLMIKQQAFSLQDMAQADELWICSSTREIMPITTVDNQPINHKKVGEVWGQIYDNYQQLKND